MAFWWPLKQLFQLLERMEESTWVLSSQNPVRFDYPTLRGV
jgi:hypothetical protein